MVEQSQQHNAVRGRPRKMSRDDILSAAVDMLERQPEVPIALNRVARELGVTPMAIYTYFANVNDLLQALTERLLCGLVVSVDERATPLEKVAAWCGDVRAFFRRHPQLLTMLVWDGGHVSVAWFDRSVVLVGALREMGLDGVALSRATLWVWSVIMGAIGTELRELSMPHSLTPDQVDSIDPSLREPVRIMLGLVAEPGYFDDFFTFQVGRLLDGLLAFTRWTPEAADHAHP